MKKLFPLILVVVLIVTISTSCTSIKTENHASPGKLVDLASCNIRTVYKSKIADNFDWDEVKAYIRSGGILLFMNDAPQKNIQIAQKLELPIEIDEQPCDAATLYYVYGNGQAGISIIHKENDTAPEISSTVLEETVYNIQTRQEVFPFSSASQVQTNYRDNPLGTIELVGVNEPRGNIHTSFSFYTVRDYMGKNFYVIHSFANGKPGCVLYTSDSAYEKKYQIKDLLVKVESLTGGSWINDYAPGSMHGESSVSAQLSASFDGELSPGLTAALAYSSVFPKANITATIAEPVAQWHVSLSGDSQKKSFSLESTVVYSFPNTLPSADFSIYGGCTLDAWNTRAQDAENSRVVHCTATSLQPH